MKYQKVLKHGCSLAIVIPAQVCREVKIRRGDMVILRVLNRSGMSDGVQRFILEISPIIEEGEKL